MTETVFRPHPLLRNAHVQTLAAVYLSKRKYPYLARRHVVPLADGDQIMLHDDCPTTWKVGGRVAVLLHGLGGSYQSGYMVRIAAKLNALGIRTFRKDLRGCGAGFALARRPLHSGRSDDAAAALHFVTAQCPDSPVTLIGFSLGGNIALKLLGESDAAEAYQIQQAIAVCPPVDLDVSCRHLIQPKNRFYDRRFVRQLLRQYAERCRLFPDGPTIRPSERPRNLWDFDDKFTSPICGFDGAEDYYRRCSARRYVAGIDVPTKILAAADDPLVPAFQFDTIDFPGCVDICMTEGGGHLGFIARRSPGRDRRWMDWCVVDWVQNA